MYLRLSLQSMITMQQSNRAGVDGLEHVLKRFYGQCDMHAFASLQVSDPLDPNLAAKARKSVILGHSKRRIRPQYCSTALKICGLEFLSYASTPVKLRR